MIATGAARAVPKPPPFWTGAGVLPTMTGIAPRRINAAIAPRSQGRAALVQEKADYRWLRRQTAPVCATSS